MNENEIDKHIGKRIRSMRLLRGLSQVQLSKNTGVTYQQIQKYETGKNRMGGSRIYKIANILEVSPLYFFEGLPDIILKNPTIIDPETAKIINLIQNMDDRSKKAFKLFIKSLVPE
ncbi:MAG: helix-turn-helix transcriptional regulator [Deltaproteobacteria bacterium]|nr:helix-turn-helix transcriptional regulator [Deltaproteobacteria bacterium]